MRYYFMKFLFVLLFITQLQAVEPEDQTTTISLEGHLGRTVLEQASEALSQKNLRALNAVILIINSTSGDLNQSLEFAKQLYALKQRNTFKLIVFIEDSALGPAAIFPFLADELYTSISATWGDIALGSNDLIPANILRSRVIGLLPDSHPQVKLLRTLASLMASKSLSENQLNEFPEILAPPKNEALVINQNQMQTLGLLQGELSIEKFKEQFSPEVHQEKNVEAVKTKETLAISQEVFDAKLKTAIHFNPDGDNTIGHIVIDDRTSGISQATWLYVKNALDYYKTQKPIFIILELNTPGGEVFAAQRISDALKEMDTQYNIPVVAYINNWAISAGAMLAYSSRFITVVKDGAMGAAEPVINAQTGEMKEASEKVNSALRADFANRASFFDRNPLLAEAMVDKDIILVLRHNQIVKLDQESEIIRGGLNPDKIITPKGKLLTLNGVELIEYGVADRMIFPAKTELITPEEKEKGKWPASKMALFATPFFNAIPNAKIDAYVMDWKTEFFVILAHPVVTSALFLGLMLGVYIEMSSGGFGLAGTVALTSLFLIILSSFAQEIGGVLELIFLVVGLAVILIELFVLPSFGLLGFIGILLFVVGLFGLMLPGAGAVAFEFDTRTLNSAGEAFFNRLAWLSMTLVLGVFLMVLFGRFFMPVFAGYSRFVLKGNEQENYRAVEGAESLPSLGSEGIVAATLRPAGKVIIQDRMFDALSSGQYIEKNAEVVVTGYDGGSLVVIQIRKEPS